MTGIWILVGYVVAGLVGTRLAARFMARQDDEWDSEQEPWGGLEWVIIIGTFLFWPVWVPIGHLMTRNAGGRPRRIGKAQRIISGRA